MVGNEIREVARHQVMQGLELMVRSLDFIQSVMTNPGCIPPRVTWPDLHENTHCGCSDRVNCVECREQLDAIAETQAKEGGGLGQDACRGGSEKWSDAGYVLMAEPVGFAPGLHVQSEGRRGIKNHSSF